MENPKINLEKKMQGNAESQSSPRIPIEIRPNKWKQAPPRNAEETSSSREITQVRHGKSQDKSREENAGKCRKTKLTTNPNRKFPPRISREIGPKQVRHGKSQDKSREENAGKCRKTKLTTNPNRNSANKFFATEKPEKKKTFLSEVPGNAEKTSSPQTPY